MIESTILKAKKILRDNPFTSDLYYLSKVLRDMPPNHRLRLYRLNLFRKTYANTMVGYARLSNAYELSRKIEQQSLPGAFVECGVWRGGCIATMAWVAKKANSNRAIWLFDSFQGMPEPSNADLLADGEKAVLNTGNFGASEEIAKYLLFSKLKLDPSSVHIVKGWFHDTVPLHKNTIGPISILRLDGDFYDSTKICLNNLYQKVVPGGYVIIDDYGGWEGAKLATDEFMQGMDVGLQTIDKKGRYFQKPMN